MRKTYAGFLLLCGMLVAAPILNAASRPVAKRVPPIFPELAKRMHVTGSVRLEVNVNPAGKVENVKVVSGHMLLGAAATDAVKAWTYQPGDAATTEIVEIDFK